MSKAALRIATLGRGVPHEVAAELIHVAGATTLNGQLAQSCREQNIALGVIH